MPGQVYLSPVLRDCGAQFPRLAWGQGAPAPFPWEIFRGGKATTRHQSSRSEDQKPANGSRVGYEKYAKAMNAKIMNNIQRY